MGETVLSSLLLVEFVLRDCLCTGYASSKVLSTSSPFHSLSSLLCSEGSVSQYIHTYIRTYTYSVAGHSTKSTEMADNQMTWEERRRLVGCRFVGGTIGGFLQAISSHPLDTVKARLQSGMYRSSISCISHTWRNEGLRGFFRGVQMPLFFGGVFNSVLFSLNQIMQIVVSPPGRVRGEPLALWRVALAAQLATPLYVMVLTPIDRVKVVMQLESQQHSGHSGGLQYCVAKIHRHNGYRGFFRGYWPTVGVHMIGLPSYFVGYQVASQELKQWIPPTVTGSFLFIPMLSGVAAGSLFWLSSYPLDLIKTKVQAVHGHCRPRDVIYEVYAAGGLPAFFRGFSVSFLRSIPANASVWCGLALAQRWMN